MNYNCNTNIIDEKINSSNLPRIVSQNRYWDNVRIVDTIFRTFFVTIIKKNRMTVEIIKDQRKFYNNTNIQ